ncbi:protogenin A-like isoform X2 [Porites lutea]|uniref:protogenin A-like isoform X2 n=1 Tax=Porites lutea TaxID=51062 RepID=UPI003CC6B91E
MASTRPSPNLSTFVSGLHLIFTLASVAFLSYKVYYLEYELSLIRGKECLSDGRIRVTEATPLSLIPNGEELRSERNRRAEQERVISSSAGKLKEACVQKLLDDLQVIDGVVNRTGRLVCMRAPPRFTKKPPSSIVIKDGSNMTFSFSISGYPKPKVTWSMKTKTQENQTRFTVLADKFEMSDVRFADEGVITSRAENMFGIQVTEVKITVRGAPRFPNSPPVQVHGYLGKETRIQCDPLGNPTPKIEWTRTPSAPLPRGRSEVRQDGLYIKNTESEDDGIYTCIAANEFGRVIQGAYLKVNSFKPPAFTTPPPDAINASGIRESVRVNCSATGAPLPNVTWYKNNVTIPSTYYANTAEVTGELVIDQFQPSDQATYTCIARNMYKDEVKTSTKIVLTSCGDPGKPNNSAVVIQSQNHWAGQYVWYFCNPGYTMIGPAIKRCFPSGNWTGYTPRCTDKLECERYWTIDDPTRRYGFRSGETKSDTYLPEGWYRFITGKQMSTICRYSSGYCDASNQASLQGSHPTVEEGVVSRKVCFGYYQSRYRYGQKQINTCCKQSTYIKVRNCGSFYVYKLKPTPSNSRYCTQY